MKIFFSKTHKLHLSVLPEVVPDDEDWYFEIPKRVDSILNSLKKVDWAEISSPLDFGEEPIYEIHTTRYLDYLKHAYDEWKILSNDPGLAFIPYKPGFDPQSIGIEEISDQDGFFMTNMNVPVSPKSHLAAVGSVNSALSAAQTVLTQKGASFALCRPPGHHAGREKCGGFCFLNNAAIAAQWLSKHGKVAIMDIDYHAGNGTQAIFYERPDILTISLHADPAWEYPSFAGFADEIGSGPGEGYHHNFPLPHETGDELYQKTLNLAVQLLTKNSPDFLVVSAGFDTYHGDPLGDFKITRDGFSMIGKMISDLKIPTAILLEGGYKTDDLGDNVVAFLKPFA